MKHLFSLPVRVYYEDTDSGGVVYHSNYLSFCDRCRTEWLRSLGFNQTDLIQNDDLCFVIHKLEAKFLKSARMDDDLIIHMDLLDRTPTRLVFNQIITWRGAVETDKPAFIAKVEVVCVELSKMKPREIPQFIVDALTK